MPDRYIIIEGGIVQNDPGLPVFDLDVFEEGDAEQLQDMRVEAINAGAVSVAQACDDALIDMGLVPGQAGEPS